jgi:phage baseplate assembly protein gpV
MPKFTVVKLIDQNKVVPARLLPDESGNKFTWQIGDTDVLEYDRATKQFTCEVYEFQNDDYELVKTLSHEDSYQVALDEGIIYE